MRKSSRMKFYKAEKAWLVFSTSSAKSGHVRTAVALFSDGNRCEITAYNGKLYDYAGCSFYSDVRAHLSEGDE